MMTTSPETVSAYQQFLKEYPTYTQTSIMDDLRKTEYGRLDEQQHCYLDYTGGSLYAESQLDKHFALLRQNVFGNPHSANPTSLAMTDLVEDARAYVMRYFNASTEEYIAVFTSNASGALKHVGESYPFAAGGRYLLTYDNHNSVNGIREFAKSKGAKYTYAPLAVPDLRIDQDKLEELLESADSQYDNLFAFPAQSNFSGVKHPLELIELARGKGWDVLLDAAAYVPTNRLDLSLVKPDFVALSFYKMFGYPTGIGLLLIHKRVFDKLQRPWFAGGTVNFASVQGNGFYLAKNEAAFEDGTIDYLGIPAVKIGLQHLESIGIDVITERVRCLTGWLLSSLYEMKHSNGRPMVRLYGPTNTDRRGGTITLNFYDPDEKFIDYRRIEELANHRGISIRTGCFCNPGAGELAEGLTAEDMRTGLAEAEDMTLPRFVQLIQHKGSNKSAGAVRISVGIATNFPDIEKFIQFVRTLRDKTNLNLGKVTFDIETCRVIRDGS